MFNLRRTTFHHPLADAGGAADPPAAGVQPIDHAALERLRQLDPDGARGFLRQVLQTYERSLDKHLAALMAAAEGGDIVRAGEVAHTLKSSSASVGAQALAERCSTVERLARAGDAAVMGAPLAALCHEATRVREAVQAMLHA